MLRLINQLLGIATVLVWFYFPLRGYDSVAYKARVLAPPLLVVWVAFCCFELATSESAIRSLLRSRAKEIFVYSLWLAVVVANIAFGRGSGGPEVHLLQSAYGLLWYLGATAISLQPHGGRKVAFALLITAGTACAIALPTTLQNPALSRLASNGITGVIWAAEAERLGIGNYQVFGALSILIATWIGLTLCESGLWKWLAFGMTTSIAISLTLTSSAAQLALLATSVVCFAVRRTVRSLDRHQLILIGTGLAIVAAISIGMGVFGDSQFDEKPSLDTVEMSPESALTYSYLKIGHLARSVITEGLYEGDDTGRRERFETSWNTFTEHSLIGFGPDTRLEGPGAGVTLHQGGHAWIIDFLAQYGIVGFAPLLIFIGLVMRRFYKWSLAEPWNGFAFGCLISLILFVLHGFKNGMLMHEYPTPMIFSLMGINGGSVVVAQYSNRRSATPPTQSSTVRSAARRS